MTGSTASPNELHHGGDLVDVGDETANEGDTSMMTNGHAEEVEDSNTMQDSLIETKDYSLYADLPARLGLMRQRLFEIEDTIELSDADFEAYWPFVDNVWKKSESKKPIKKEHSHSEEYWCRLKKRDPTKVHRPKPTPEGKTPRLKQPKKDTDCGMAINVHHEGGRYRITRAVEKHVKHAHDLDEADKAKRNTGIMNIARREAVQGFTPKSTFWKLEQERDKMEDAGGKFMQIHDCRNVQIQWRQANPFADLRFHFGFVNKGGPGRKVTLSTVAPGYAQAAPTPKEEMIPEMNHPLPDNTLRYPENARVFLEPYMPASRSQSSSTMPHVTLTYASSLDSRISLAPGLQTALSGPESKAMTHYLRSRHDAILIGVRTAITDNPSLNCRLEGAGGYGGLGTKQQPRPIIVDPYARLQITPDVKLLQLVAEGRAKAPWIIVSPKPNLHPHAVATLKSYGGEYLQVHDFQSQGQGPGLSWPDIFRILYQEGIKSIMVEGGGIVMSELLKAQYAHLIDSVIITIAPTFLGRGGVEVSPESTVDERNTPVASRLTEVKWQAMGVDVVILCGKVASGLPEHANGILSGIEEFSHDTSGNGVKPA